MRTFDLKIQVEQDRARALLVSCPACQQLAGRPCLINGHPSRWIHEARHQKQEALCDV